MCVRIAILFLFLVVVPAPAPGGQEPPALLLKVDATSSGPFGGEKSFMCLRVFADGKVLYFYKRLPGGRLVDRSTGQEIERAEKSERREYRLEEAEARELAEFLGSKAVLRLGSSYPPPHRPIDYFEVYTVEVVLPNRRTKRIAIREFFVSSLAERTRYPSALIVLMGKIEQVESEAFEKGTPIDTRFDCPHDK
jgi:hypothetical protein